MSALVVSRTRVAVDDSDAAGLLVSHDGALVAVLVCLDDEIYGANKGRWYLEAGFGRCAVAPIIFDDSEAMIRWVAGRLNLSEENDIAALRSINSP